MEGSDSTEVRGVSLVADQPPGVTHVVYTMAALCGVGALAGFARARSARSLVVGLGFGAMFGWQGTLIASGENTEQGYRLAGATSAVLSAVMASRWRKTGRFMPSGLLVLSGAGSAAYHIWKWRECAQGGDEESPRKELV